MIVIVIVTVIEMALAMAMATSFLGTVPEEQRWRDTRRAALLAVRMAAPRPQRRQWSQVVTQQRAG